MDDKNNIPSPLPDDSLPILLPQDAGSAVSENQKLTRSDVTSSQKDIIDLDNDLHVDEDQSGSFSPKMSVPRDVLSPQNVIADQPERSTSDDNDGSLADPVSLTASDENKTNTSETISPENLIENSSETRSRYPPDDNAESTVPLIQQPALAKKNPSSNEIAQKADNSRRTRLITDADLIKIGEHTLRGMFEANALQSSKFYEAATPELDIGCLSLEEFKPSTPLSHRESKRPGHRISDPPARRLHTIEVLLKDSTHSTSRPLRKRHIHHKDSGAATEDGTPPSMPDRIRLRSNFILGLLHRVTGVKLDHGGSKSTVEERDSLVFLYPFKFFVTFAEEIKAEADRLKKYEQSKAPTHANRGVPEDEHKVSLGSAASSENGGNRAEDDYESEKAFKHLDLVVKLMDKYLQPVFDLRESYRNATHTTIFFHDLWLLFETGGLIFRPEPLPDHPPQISRIIEFNGGRQLLNNGDFKSQEGRRDIPGANSKGLENQFCLHHYSLGFNGECYGPIYDRMTIPAWEGERNIHDLKLFPLQFVRNKKDHKFHDLATYKSHVIGRGKEFVKLEAIDHRYYKGEVVGTHKEFYSSAIVIDFKLQRRDTERQSGLLGWMEHALNSESDLVTGLSIHPGDPREVQEGTKRKGTSEECVYPGCDDNEFIHDDLSLDDIIAHQKLSDHGRTSAKFQRSEIGSLTEEDYLLFPSFIYGYVLKIRDWAKLHMDSLKLIPDTGSQLDELRIGRTHKESLRALCSSDNLALDVTSGKGQGIIILLHGQPGVGKTATAEAMAADLQRPLYPITYADLGKESSTAETNLKRIFRYGQRWECVLLLDEADVFLMKRDRQDTIRNGIVSVFQRNLEWYPGLIFLTTNWLDKFDPGILDRVHLKLLYPRLSDQFTEEIFNDHFKKINDTTSAQGASSGKRDDARTKYEISKANMKAIQTWRKKQYSEAGPGGWWNGRFIRSAFQMAAAFARQDMMANDGRTAQIRREHFEKVAESDKSFKADLSNANEDKRDGPEELEED